MLLSKEIEIKIKHKRKRYEALGYDIPLVKKQLWNKGKKNGIKMVIPNNATIKVKVLDLPKYSADRVLCKCDNCGKEYTLTYSRYNIQTETHDGKLYCCDCVQRVCFSGENNNFWNNELSNEERQIRNEGFRHINGYTDFIKQVLFLSNYTCFICGSKENLEVHHLDGYEWCKNKRTEISNGICLCNKCHKIFHSVYGYKGNTKQQFEEWIGSKIKTFNDKNKVNLKPVNKVICLETKEIYNSAYECEKLVFKRKRKGLGTAIRSCCNRQGVVENLHFVWYNDYLKMNNDEIDKILNKKKFSQPKTKRKVVCIENKQIFDSVTNAIKFYNKVTTSNLIRHIKGERKTFVGCHWCYAEDYKGNINQLQKAGDGW